MMNRCDAAIARAARALLHSRGDDGLWRDFQTLAGESCDWVTAFVAFAVDRSNALEDETREAVRSLYYRQRPSGGWGYNEQVPPDCDSTAWVLLAASIATLWRPSAIGRAVAYVRRHWNADGRGFSTYAKEDAIERYIEAPRELTEGWMSSHPCVTAVALQSLMTHRISPRDPLVRDALIALREKQNDGGVWASYWWRGHAYATHHVLRALLMGEALTPEVWLRARDGLIALQHSDGGWGDDANDASQAFATAMCTLSLLLRPDVAALEPARAGIDYLLQSESEGFWPAVPILRLPAPITTSPVEHEAWPADMPGTETIVTGQHGVFTTAAALWALTVARDVM